MRRSVNNAVITKTSILEKISQQAIMAMYLDIDIETVDYCIETGRLINSPLRDDRHPSFGFAFNNRGQLKCRDFAGYFWGDCWDVVAYVLSYGYNKQINVSNKQDFMFILKHVAYTFRHIYYGKERDTRVDNVIHNAIHNIKNSKSIIEIVPREWSSFDIKYWSQFGISVKWLNTHFVYPVEQYYINRNSNPEPKYFYSSNKKDVCYGYLLGQDSRGIYSWKLYFPNRKKTDIRFITNCNHLEGIYNLDKDKTDYDYIIITKSTKDRLAIGEHLYEYPLRGIKYDISVGVINIPHETHKLTQEEYTFLNTKLKPNGKLITLFDNDRTGYMCSIEYNKTWNTIPICIPRELNAKDFAELKSLYSPETINNYISQTLEYIKTNYEDGTELTWENETSSIIPY